MRPILHLGGEKTELLSQSLSSILWIWRLLFIKEFPRTVLAAEVIISPGQLFPNGSSRWDIDLATRVLNKFFGLRLAVQPFLLCEYFFHEKVKTPKEEEKKKDE